MNNVLLDLSREEFDILFSYLSVGIGMETVRQKVEGVESRERLYKLVRLATRLDDIQHKNNWCQAEAIGKDCGYEVRKQRFLEDYKHEVELESSLSQIKMPNNYGTNSSKGS